MIIKLFGSTHTGYYREINEDFYYIEEHPYPLMMVADGVGGERKGEVASELASQAIIAHLYNFLKNGLSRRKLNILLKEIFSKVNILVHKAGRGSTEFHGMCTTLTLALIYNGILFISHVGDSEAFLIRNERIIGLTKLHTLANTLKIKSDNHPYSHVLTQVIGQNIPIKVDSRSLLLNDNDLIILATDGLSKHVTVREIKKIALASEVNVLPENLISLALERGGHDNITVTAGKILKVSDDK